MGEAPKMATVRLSAARSIYCRVSLCRNQNFLQDVTIFSIENASVLSLQKKKKRSYHLKRANISARVKLFLPILYTQKVSHGKRK